MPPLIDDALPSNVQASLKLNGTTPFASDLEYSMLLFALHTIKATTKKVHEAALEELVSVASKCESSNRIGEDGMIDLATRTSGFVMTIMDRLQGLLNSKLSLHDGTVVLKPRLGRLMAKLDLSTTERARCSR